MRATWHCLLPLRRAATAAVLEDAARAVAYRGATDAAAALAAHAVTLSDPNDAQGIRRRRYLAAEHLWASGDVDRARAELETIIKAAPAGPIRAHALLRRARYAGDLLESRRLGQEALQQTRQNLALRSDALVFLAMLEFDAGGDADELLAKAIESASEGGDELRRVRGEIWRALFDWYKGHGFDREVLDRAEEVDAALVTQHVVPISTTRG